MFFVTKRAALIMPTGNGPHCFVIVTDPNKVSKDVLIVPFCSLKKGFPYDGSCLLNKGDHDFIKQDTWVAYRFLSIVSAKSLDEGIKKKEFSEHKPCSTEIHARICHGLLHSTQTAPKFKTYYEDSLKPVENEQEAKK